MIDRKNKLFEKKIVGEIFHQIGVICLVNIKRGERKSYQKFTSLLFGSKKLSFYVSIALGSKMYKMPFS